MNVIHFNAEGKGLYGPGGPECGASSTGRKFFKTLISSDVTHVDCKRCMKTKAYKDAEAKKAKEEWEYAAEIPNGG